MIVTAVTPIIDRARTPEAWIELLAEKQIILSPRTLRGLARRWGACHKFGRVMLITPEQIDHIIESQKKCPSNLIPAARSGGRAAESNTMARRLPNTTDAALAHLRNRALGTGAGRKSKGSSASTC